MDPTLHWYRSTLAHDAPLRLAAATALAVAPLSCANRIVAARFADTSGSTAAFGANLLGALLGGTLEYLSLVVGYRALLLIAGGLYLLAFVLKPRRPLGAAKVMPHERGAPVFGRGRLGSRGGRRSAALAAARDAGRAR